MAQAVSTTNEYLRPQQIGHVRLVSDTAANDSNKTLTVTAGKIWQPLHIYASLVCTATVGNRQLDLIVADPDAVEIYRNRAVDVQAATTTNYYFWSPGIAVPAETVATFHHLPFPFTYLPGGSTIQIYDSTAVDAAADDLTLNMLVIEYEG